MDIYSFLNSKDIAEHCRRLQKTWTPLQMALIISRSDRSVPDKHRAWRELISDYPDMPVPPLPECEITNGFESLHKMLLAQIDYEKCALRSFRNDTREQAEIKTEPCQVDLPPAIIETFARFLVPEIRKYYDSEQGQREFAE